MRWLLALLFAAPAFASDIGCFPPTPINGGIEFYDCEYPVNDRYNPPGFFMNYGVGYDVPYPAPRNHSLPLVMLWRPHGPQPDCPNNGNAAFDKLIVNNCNDYYPSETYHMVDNVGALGWGGFYFGLSNAYRTDAAITKAHEMWGDSIDTGAGITLGTKSYAGAVAWNQTLMLGLINSPWQSKITKILTTVPPVGMLEPDKLLARDARMQVAWAGADASLLDHLKHADQLRMMYFATQFASNDHTVYASVDWLRRLCEQVACRAMWAPFDHSWPPPPEYSYLPWETWFDAPDMDVRLDDPFLIVFSKAITNNYGAVGHINLGLRWRNLAVTATGVSMQLRYVATAPGQALQSSVNVIVRLRTQVIRYTPGEVVAWRLGASAGQAIVTKAGEVTVPVVLNSGAEYTTLTIDKTGEIIPGC